MSTVSRFLSILRQILVMLDAKSVRVGLTVAGVSLFAAFTWIGFSQPPLCPILNQTNNIANNHVLIALFILFFWSFCLFLTVIPLGTTTIFLAGFFLGPIAGIVQFISLIVSSLLLFQISKDKSDNQLEGRLSAWPKLSKWASLAHNHGMIFSAVLRLVPIVPSAGSALAAAYFSISRRDFLVGTFLTGWVRPVGFATLGALGKFAPICGLNLPTP